MSDFRCCAVVPTFDNPATVAAVVARAREHVGEVIVVDDASGSEGREACAALGARGAAVVIHREANGGKGAAVKTGLAAARARGYTHAFQIDADGQHDLERMPAFLEAAARAPGSAVLGYPVYDASAPKGRLAARKITRFWVDLEVGGRGVVEDAMVGFRIYPLASTSALRVRGDRMDFDVEIAVRLVWAGVPVINLPVGVRYLRAEEGGRSHFQPLGDNLRLAWLHSRLCTLGASRYCLRKLRLPPLLGPHEPAGAPRRASATRPTRADADRSR
jgi:glycosyltransferase involved in cell wall biosynthesis